MLRPRSLLLLPLLLGVGGFLPADPLRAADAPHVAVRTGGQGGMGRLVFSWPDAPGYSLTQDGAVVDLRFGALGRLALDAVIANPPPNVVRVEPVPSGLRLHLKEGARARHFLQGPRVVVEIAGPQGFAIRRGPTGPAQVAQPPASGPTAPSAAPFLAEQEEAVLAAIAALRGLGRPAEALGALPTAAPRAAPPLAATPSQPPPTVPPPAAFTPALEATAPSVAARRESTAPREPAERVEPGTTVASVPAVPAPPAAAARPSDTPPVAVPSVLPPAVAAAPPERSTAAQASPFVLPLATSVHAVALVRGDSLILAFDHPQGLKAETLRRLSDSLGPIEVMEVPGSTVLRQRAPARGLPKLRAVGDAWALWPAGAGPAAPLPGVTPAHEPGQAGPGGAAPRMLLPAEGAGRVIAIPDPAGEGLLLVGLVSGPGVANPVLRHFEPFDILPTEVGVALAIRSDAVTLRPAREGFAVPLARSGPLAVTLPPAASSAGRLMELPNESLQELDQRRRVTFGKLTEAEPQARGELRLNLAQDLLALGLGPESQGVALMAVAEDPRLAGNPRALMLAGAAAFVAGRRDEAKPSLMDPRLPALEETRLWRALASLEDTELRPEPTQVIADLAATAPMLRDYPVALRQRLLPLAARALAGNGAPDAAAALLDGVPAEDAAWAGTAYARARLAEARGDNDAALAAYRALTQSRDSDMRARALGRAAELQLASGGADAATTAAALAASIPAWRGDARELGRRLRAASLYQQGGRPELALELLEETESLFPEAEPEISPLRQAADLERATNPSLPPLEAAQRLAEALGSLPAGPTLDAAALRVADRLAELDLHAQGAALLQRAAARSGAPAALRLRQAEMLVASGQGSAALDVLRTNAPAGAVPLERRELTEARAMVLAGDGAGAEAVLRRLGAAGAASLADLLAKRQDWAGAAQALAQHADGVLPQAPAQLDEAQRQLLLRLAAFRALSGDEARVAELRATYGPRMAGGPLAEAFATLVAEAPRPGVPDLGRLRSEIAMGQKLTEQLRALR